MKFQNPSLNSVLNGRKDERTDERTSRKQYAPHFFKVGGIKRYGATLTLILNIVIDGRTDRRNMDQFYVFQVVSFPMFSHGIQQEVWRSGTRVNKDF